MRAIMRFSERVPAWTPGEKIAEGTPARDRNERECGEGLPWCLELAVGDLEAGYGAVRALHGVSLRCVEGETVALLGTNGNGKSTLMKCIMGLVAPDARRRSCWSSTASAST